MHILLWALVFTLPPTLTPFDADVAAVVAERQEEFLDVCYQHQRDERCDRVVRRANVEIVADFTFRTRASQTGLASGLFWNGRRVKVALYGKIATNNPADCADSPVIRTRQEMYELSGRNKYWLSKPETHWCANPADLLPALVHELCHAFGRQVGHRSAEGYDECESVP